MATPETEALFYDIDKLNEIPILSVAAQIGLTVQKQGSNHWCQTRSAENALVYLDPALNSFYAFGPNVHGDVIRFVGHCKNLSPPEAVALLAEQFDIVPTLTREELYRRPISNWEYKKIGLHGDMTTKNLSFPIDSHAVQMLQQLGNDQNMPLSSLQSWSPEFYKHLLLKKALPYVTYLRNSYQRDVLNFYYSASLPGESGLKALREGELQEYFSKATAHLNRCEGILYRAGLFAGLELPEPTKIDPVILVHQLLQGDQTLTLGNCSFSQLSALADRSGCSICETDIPASTYFTDCLLRIGHCAIYHGGNVLVQYLSSDEAEILSLVSSVDRPNDFCLSPLPPNNPIRPADFPGNDKQK